MMWIIKIQTCELYCLLIKKAPYILDVALDELLNGKSVCLFFPNQLPSTKIADYTFNKPNLKETDNHMMI